jgi:hypothetical protein
MDQKEYTDRNWRLTLGRIPDMVRKNAQASVRAEDDSPRFSQGPDIGELNLRSKFINAYFLKKTGYRSVFAA